MVFYHIWRRFLELLELWIAALPTAVGCWLLLADKTVLPTPPVARTSRTVWMYDFTYLTLGMRNRLAHSPY